MAALELRPNCEYCDRDLPPDATEAWRAGRGSRSASDRTDGGGAGHG
ncbi:MAG: DUF1272 domain-containing protein [Polyangia bacterium]